MNADLKKDNLRITQFRPVSELMVGKNKIRQHPGPENKYDGGAFS